MDPQATSGTESKVRGKKESTGCAVAFMAVFLLAGLAGFYFLTLRPVLELVDARGWTETPCTILTSEVGSHRSDDGTTYSIDITYEYEWGGEVLTGDRYNLAVGSSSGYDGKARVVADHPPGSTALCFVDREDPTRSVIDRQPGLYLLWGLIPLVFIVVGLGGILGALWFKGMQPRRLAGPQNLSQAVRSARASAATERRMPGRRRPERRMPGNTIPGGTLAGATVSVSPGDSGGSVVLENRHSPMKKLVGMIFFAAIWNGVVSIFLFAGEAPDGCAILFLSVFALIGLGAIGGVGYFLLALFNPRPKLVVGTGRLEPGSEASLAWSFDGRAGRIRAFTIKLEGREKATYRRGTNTRTDTHVFYESILLEENPFRGMDRGSSQLTISEGIMPSFESSNNKIEWAIVVHGDIPRWPDVHEEFIVTVHPPIPGGSP